MNAMVSYRDFAPHPLPAITPASGGGAHRPGLARRLFAAVAQMQRSRADREIVRFFGGRLGEDGVRLTDQLERKLADHFAPRGGFQP